MLLKRLSMERCVGCLILGAFIELASDISVIGTVDADLILIVEKVIYLAFFLFVGAFCADLFWGWLAEDGLYKGKSRIVLKGTVVLCAFWLPYLIVFFPAVLHYDTLYSIRDFFDGYTTSFYVEGGYEITTSLNAHHPVLDTLLYGLFVSLGNYLGNPNLGVFLLAFLQMLSLAYAFSAFADYYFCSRQIYKPVWCGYLFMGLFPFVALFSVTIIKNTIFTIAILLFVNVFRQRFVCICDESVNEARKIIIYILLSLFVSLSNKTGIFVVVVCDFAIIIREIVKKKKVKIDILVSSLVTIAVCCVIIPKVVYPLFDIFPGGKQEMYSPILMQTACTVVEHDDEIPIEEKLIINQVIDYGSLEEGYLMYNGTYSQEVKNRMRTNYTSEDMQAYFIVWLKQLFRFPMSYIRGILGVSGGNFAVSDRGIMDVYYSTSGILDEEYPGIEECNILGISRDIVKNTYSWLSELPGVNILFRAVFYTLLVPSYTLFYLIKNRRYIDLGIYIPFGVILLFLFVSPVTKARYILPLVCLCPILIMNCFAPINKENF